MSPGALLTLAGVLAALGFWLNQSPMAAGARFPMPAGKTYVAECGACHTAYPSGLLPARSWRVMVASLDAHFGEDASLSEPDTLAVLRALETLAADGAQANRRMRRAADSIAANATPQRISTLPYFRALHDEVPADVWKRKDVGGGAHCQVCHARANEGRYDEREVAVPAASRVSAGAPGVRAQAASLPAPRPTWPPRGAARDLRAGG